MAGLFGRPNALLTGLAGPVLVRNVTGSSTSQCKCCDSWFDHCRRAADGLLPYHCSAVHCRNVATVGGHVIMLHSADRSWRIVPLCDSCNALGRAYEIYGHTRLVPAQPLPSCIH